MLNDQGETIILNFSSAILYSGFSFFSMEYNGLKPQGLLSLLTLIEVFISQIIIITFIGIIAGKLVEKLDIIKVKNE